MTQTQKQNRKNAIARIRRSHGKTVRFQTSSHGCGRFSLQAFSAPGALVADINL